MSEILLSLPVSWFIVRIILTMKYFAGLNFLSIFIVSIMSPDLSLHGCHYVTVLLVLLYLTAARQAELRLIRTLRHRY